VEEAAHKVRPRAEFVREKGKGTVCLSDTPSSFLPGRSSTPTYIGERSTEVRHLRAKTLAKPLSKTAVERLLGSPELA
jgi:hypothetical protein